MAKAKEERAVIYPKVEVVVCQGKNALTADQAKSLLGWEEIPEGSGKSVIPLLTDKHGNKVRCLNNGHNRPFAEEWSLALAQDILQGNWKLNGETVIIGATGLVLSAQHRLVGLVLAQQQLDIDRKEGGTNHYEDSYPDGVIGLETLICYGVSEDPATTRTLDNVKPRTLADVIYADTEMFGSMKPAARASIAKAVDYAVSVLWDRLGMKTDPYKPKQTHSEALEFLSRHPRLLKAVKHCWEEDQLTKEERAEGDTTGKVQRYVSVGMAGALLYLMGSSDSDPMKYYRSDDRGDRLLSWKRWDKAEEFWTLLAGKAPDIKAIRYACRGQLTNDKDEPLDYYFVKGESGGSRRERFALLVKGWGRFVEGKKIRPEDVKLEYETREDGEIRLKDTPLLGGIDLGGTKAAKQADPTGNGEEQGEGDPTPEEIEARKEAIREENGHVPEEKKGKGKKPSQAQEPVASGT